MLIGLLLIPSAVALADQSYHTERLSLTLTPAGGVAGHTLRNGMVVNIHPNGPVNGAIENYVLNGAKPNTEYQVSWNISEIAGEPVDPPLEVPTGMVVQTDKKGNGHCTFKISYDQQTTMGFHGFDGQVTWLFVVEGGTIEDGIGPGDVIAFQTEPTHVIVD